MPIERNYGTGGFRYGGGAAPGTPMRGPKQLYGSLHTPVPPMQQAQFARNQRTPNPIEQLDLTFSQYAPDVLTAPARIAERPIAFADALTGGAATGVIRGIGDFAASNKDGEGGPGPIGAFFKSISDGITALDTAGAAWANSGYAEQVAKYANRPDSSPIDFGTDGWLFGLGERKMTVAEMKAEIDKRGWRTDPATGETMTWEELQAKARDNRFAFGDRALTSSLALDTLARMVVSPTNALFFVPGAGWVAAGNKLRGAAAGVIEVSNAARWAKPIVTAASAVHRTRYGFGYLKDPAIAVLRSPQVVDTTIAARELLAGSTKYASVRALLTAADTVLRGGQIVGKGLGKFAGYRAPINPSMWGYTKALSTGYYRGALRLQVGSVAAEFAAGRAAQDSEGTIFEGITNTVHQALVNINNDRPLSDNETFMVFALTTMPAFHLIGQEIGAPGRAIRAAKGNNDAVLLAKEMNLEGGVNELYTKAGDGDAARGQQVIEWALQQAERGAAFKDLGMTTRQLGSFDAYATNNQVLSAILGDKVMRMREAGRITSEARVRTFFDVPRRGEIISKAERPFEWNASNDAVITSWSRFYKAWEVLAPQARKLGITAMTLSKIVTREMLQDALAVIERDAPANGIMPNWVRDQVLLHLPGLLEDPKAYGDFWARVATHSEEKSISGKGKGADTRIRMEELTEEMRKLSEAVPSANELFHEAGVLERQKPGGVTVDALAGSKIRKVHSPAVVKQLRDDATGQMRALRQEEKVLSHIRNTEFTRNGAPKVKSVDTTVGYKGTIIKRSDPTGIINDNGTPIVDMFEHENGQHFWFDPDDPTQFYVGVLEEHPDVSEIIVKAVELGGRTIKHTILDDNMEGQFLARHGFVEVARQTVEVKPSPLMQDPTRIGKINWTRKTMKDGSEVWVDDVTGLIGGPTTETIGYYAYVGGNPSELRNKLGSFEGRTKMITVYDPGTHQNMGQVEVPAQPETIPVDSLVKFREIDREILPKNQHDPGYLDRLEAEIEASIKEGLSINTKAGTAVPAKFVSVDPVTIGYDLVNQRALLTDGNHRLAVLLRLQKKYNQKFNIPVKLEFERNLEGDGVYAPISEKVYSVQAIVGMIGSEFPPYKPSNRIVKDTIKTKKQDIQRAFTAADEGPGIIFHGSKNHTGADDFSRLDRNDPITEPIHFADDAEWVGSDYSTDLKFDDASGKTVKGETGAVYKAKIRDDAKLFDYELYFDDPSYPVELSEEGQRLPDADIAELIAKGMNEDNDEATMASLFAKADELLRERGYMGEKKVHNEGFNHYIIWDRNAFDVLERKTRITHDVTSSASAKGIALAQKRADQASLLVPSVDAIGPSPTSAEGLFHGSQAIFDQFDNDMLSSSSLVGRGVYTTDDLGVAMGYAGGGRGNIYRVEPKPGLKTYDLMKPFGEDDWELKAELHEVLIKHDNAAMEVERARKVYQAAFDEATAKIAEIREKLIEGPSDELAADLGYWEASLEAAGESLGNLIADETNTASYQFMERAGSGFDLFRQLFDEYPPEEVGQINDELIRVFQKHGYEGFTHEGGLLVGNKTHNVTVAFDANDMNIKERVDPKQFTPATGARHALLTRRMGLVREQMKQQAREIEILDQRAEELRTIKLPESLADQTIPKDKQDELLSLVSQLHAEYPQYDFSMDKGLAFWDPADGLVPGLRLERSEAQRVLFDYGPMSRVSALYDNIFGPVSSKRLSKMARTAVYNRALAEGATTRQVGQILAELNSRVREQTVGPLRVPWFRDITSLPAQQINTIARNVLDEKTWANIESRYGSEGFHHLLDEASNEFIRRVDKNVQRGNENGKLARSLREGYRMWSYAPVVGSGTRIVSKQFYHVFRFMLDVRWHLLNLIEADLLSLGREGVTRFGKQSDEIGKGALMVHSNKAGIPEEFFAGTNPDAGPSAASAELFDAGLYLHNRNILPIVSKNFDKSRLRSVEQVLDELPKQSSLYRMLEERFGVDSRTWSKQLDDMMYDFDNKGVRETVYATARKDGWSEDEIVQYGGLLERITELNQKAYDDIVSVYTGNLNRTRLERVLNSYWFYWPISYQIKATKWMYNALLNRWGGMQTNMAPLYLFNKAAERYNDLLMNNQQFQQEMENNEDLWFAVNMLFPATPLDTGVSLNRGVRYVGSLLAPEVIPPYIGIDGPEDIPLRVLEMGPIYTAKFIQGIVNQVKKNDNDSSTVPTGPRMNGPLVRPTP